MTFVRQFKCNIGAQRLKQQTLWLKRIDSPSFAYVTRQKDRVDTDIGSQIKYRETRFEDLAEQGHLTLAVFAVEFQRPADIRVVPVEEKLSVAAILESIEGFRLGHLSIVSDIHRFRVVAILPHTE